MVALLRAINLGGTRMVPMARLRELATSLGLTHVRTYIASGNLLFATARDEESVAVALEQTIAETFGFEVPVIVRTRARWAEYARGSAFADAEAERPKLLHIGLARRPLRDEAAAVIAAAAAPGERVAVRGDAVWLDYVEGVARTRLTPKLLDKAIGSPLTARNWRTVLELERLLAELEASLGP